MFKYTEKKLAKEIGRVAESIDPSLQYSYSADTHEVTLNRDGDEPGGPYSIFLGNLFLKVESMSRKERHPTIEAFLREVLTPKELSPDELMESLALRVRTDFEIALRNRNVELMGHDAPPSISVRRGDLLVEVVSDREESLSIARSDDLAENGVSEEEAFKIAAAKTRRGVDEGQWEKVGDSIWISRYMDDYDFARLVAMEDSVSFPFEGTPIVFAPSHSVCIATDSTDPGAISRLVEIGGEESASHRPFCAYLWTVDENGQWRRWAPEATSDANAVSALQELRETAKRFEETKDYFERITSDDVFIASFQAVDRDGQLTCYSVYTLDLPTYLPQADFVIVVDSELPKDQTVLGRIDWPDFEKCLGVESIIQIEGIDPNWHKVIQPLSASQKDELRKKAEPLN